MVIRCAGDEAPAKKNFVGKRARQRPYVRPRLKFGQVLECTSKKKELGRGMDSTG